MLQTKHPRRVDEQVKKHRVKDLQGQHLVQLVHFLVGPMIPILKGLEGQQEEQMNT